MVAPDSDAVKLWRDKFRLNLSKSWKADVDKTVTDLALWREILDGWYWLDRYGNKISKSPGIKQLLTEYERLSANKHDHEAEAISRHSGEGLSERGNGNVSQVSLQPPSEYFYSRRVVR